MRTDRFAYRSAFTLVELLFALTLGAGVCLGTRALLDALAQGRAGLAREAFDGDRTANGSRLLRSLVANARADADSTSRFEGDRQKARFASWCSVPAGWLERCIACLTVRASGDGATVMISPRCAEMLSVFNRGGPAELRYLDVSDGGSRWMETWSSAIAVPAAIGVVGDGDTLVLLVGGT